jgi:hypothetical protein
MKNLRVLGFAAIVTACGAAERTPVAAGASAEGAPPRLPDGVALEAAPARTQPADEATAGAVATLREPIADARIVAVLNRYFDAWVDENSSTLAELVAPDAQLVGGTMGRYGGGAQPLLAQANNRFRSSDYHRLVGVAFVRYETLRRQSYLEASDAANTKRYPNLKPGDEVATVDIDGSAFFGEQLFNDHVALVIRRKDRRLIIVGVLEDND